MPFLISPCFCLCPPAEFSRESLLDAGGGHKCPLSKDKMDCSNNTGVAETSSRQSATQAGTTHESGELPGESFSLEEWCIVNKLRCGWLFYLC